MCSAAATRGRARDGEVLLRRSGAEPGRSDAQDARSRDRPPARSRNAVPGCARHLQVSQTPQPARSRHPSSWRFIPQHRTLSCGRGGAPSRVPVLQETEPSLKDQALTQASRRAWDWRESAGWNRARLPVPACLESFLLVPQTFLR